MLLKFIDFNSVQNSNIPFIEVTSDVSNLDKSISIIDSIELNKNSQVFNELFHNKVTLFIFLSLI